MAEQIRAYILFSIAAEEEQEFEQWRGRVQKIQTKGGEVECKFFVKGGLLACSTETKSQDQVVNALKKYGLTKKKILAPEDWKKFEGFVQQKEKEVKSAFSAFLNALPEIWYVGEFF